MTTAALSPPLPARGRKSSRPSTLPHQKWPWGYPGQSLVESGGDALKTGRVTGALVQCPQLCPYISRIAEIESQLLSGRDSFSAIRGGKPPNNLMYSFNNCYKLSTRGSIRPALEQQRLFGYARCGF